MNPRCKVLDFRDKTSAEFKKVFMFVDEKLIEWLENAYADDYDFSDVYEFIAALIAYVLNPVDESGANFMKYDNLMQGMKAPIMSPRLFLKACSFSKKNKFFGNMS